jgi:hypothetical protein
MRSFASLGSAVARHRVIDFGVSWTRLARQKGRRGHDLARLAIAALDNLPVQPGFLDLGADCRRADCLAPSPMASRPIGSPGGVRRQSGLAVQKDAFCTPYRQSGYKAVSSRPRKKIGLCLRPPCRLIQLRIGAG